MSEEMTLVGVVLDKGFNDFVAVSNVMSNALVRAGDRVGLQVTGTKTQIGGVLRIATKHDLLMADAREGEPHVVLFFTTTSVPHLRFEELREQFGCRNLRVCTAPRLKKIAHAA